ncbi:uncharacterized protein Zaf1 isoform X2 [Drosophila takahashii]|uniref:uncharacterized protein Zaf1 isoform X2 n=1 Tax=Drosophila takahashii TaxID=29030 RepID=UPI0038996874
MEISIKWSMCRTCRKKGDGISLQSLFQSDAHKLLVSYADLVVQPDDGLPDQICSDCLDKLEEVEQFLSQCKRSDEHLRNLVRQTMSSAVAFQPAQNRDEPAGQRKRARKQNISGRSVQEQPLVIGIDESPVPTSQATTGKPINRKKSVSPQEPGDFVYVLKANGDNDKNTSQEEYTLSDLERETNDDFDTSSLEGTILDGEESQISVPTSGYNVDLAVACVPDKYRCKVCSNTYSRISLLNAHMQVHRSEKPHECDMHTNEKPYACEICGKTFSLSTSRKAHYLLHSSDKPHKCLICDKDFRLKHQLAAHEKTHAHLMGVSLAKEYGEMME